MPIYEYDCPTCGHFELIQRVSEEMGIECPTCAEAGRKQIAARTPVSVSSFHLKGGGWYKTDYSSSGSSTTGSSKKAASSDSASGSEAKADSKESSGGTPCGSSCACH
jgi:putative FmdB family regulatory protein